jgi:hypothetical protein
MMTNPRLLMGSLLFSLLIACGDDDESSGRSTDRAPSSSVSDAGSGPADATAASDATVASDDARSAQSDRPVATAADAAPEPPLDPAAARARAFDTAGMNFDTERAMLVIDAACKKLVGCGAIAGSEPECVDATLSEWALGSLFFSEACVDSQLDLFACFAQAECSSSEASCAATRASRAAQCAMEQ